MRKLHVIQPYSDDSLTYNEKTGRYYLTRQYCKDKFDPNFKSDHVLDREIEKTTDNVYDFVFSRVNTHNTELVKIILTNTQEGREFVLKMLDYQMAADIESGFNSTGKIPLVNASNGQIISREEVMRNQVSVETERLYKNSNLYLGINLDYQGVYPPYFLNYYRSN